jgi:5-hydroxyisourate hydrolase-like protein (transthyretin family)
VRHLILGAVLITLAALVGQAAPATAEPAPPPVAPVEAQVRADLRAASDRRAAFVVVMAEPAGSGPAAAVDAQLGLLEALALLQRIGTVDRATPYLGTNVIVAEGGAGAVRALAEWPGVAAIRAYRPGQAWEGMAHASPAATGRIGGAVTGPDGTTPLAGIRVTVYFQVTVETWSIVGQPTTASNGTYEVAGLAAGIYRAEFTDPAGTYAREYYNDQYAFNLATNFSVADGATTTVNASLAQAGKISGTVGGPEGGGSIVISAWRFLGGTWRSIGSAVSANNGAYTVGGLAAGTYRVRFSDGLSPPRYITEYYNNVTAIADGTDVTVTAGVTTSGINATLGGYGKITGTVTGPDGVTPVADITVDIYEYTGTEWQWVSSAATLTDGTYSAAGLVTRNYRAGFSDPTFFFREEYYNDKANVDVADDIPAQLGGTTAGINASLAVDEITLTRGLATGWNLIASPLYPTTPEPAAALSSIGGSYNLVYSYQGCDASTPPDPWKVFDPAAPPFVNDLAALGPRYGYWLNMTGPATLTLLGARPQVIGIPLCPGWNLISYPKISAVAITTALAGIAGKYTLVYAYDAADTADPWKMYNPKAPGPANDLTQMGPWLGYWINMSQAATLIVSNR